MALAYGGYEAAHARKQKQRTKVVDDLVEYDRLNLRVQNASTILRDT